MTDKEWNTMAICIIVMVIWLIWFLTKPLKPTALDVYRGKTTLEITYRDSVAVDSVVIYKTK